jgi:alpha-glucosidase
MQNAQCDQSMAFTVGRDLLVVSSPHPEQKRAFDICLPGKGWYDYLAGARIPGERLKASADAVSVFVRPGAIIAKQPLVQSTTETPKGPLELEIYPGDDCRGELYLDDGVSIHGPNLRQELTCTVTSRGVALQFGAREGTYRPWWKSIAVTVHGTNQKRRIIADQPQPATISIP